jgi:hypothetical protein
MGRYRDRPDAEPTAFNRNFEEIIYHFDLEPGTKETLELNDVEDLDVCSICGSHAVWYTSEIYAPSGFHSDEGRINRCWCDDCISQPFVDLWKAWPWTPDEKLANYTPPRHSNTNRDDRLTTHHETATILCHLDLESTATDVIKILSHYGITRDEATCKNCDQQADWYHANIYDARRDYDFEAARSNTLLCGNCINPELVDKWAGQYSVLHKAA